MGLIWLSVGLVLFAGIHLVAAARSLRAFLIEAAGERLYKAIFALVSLAGIVLMGYGFALYRRQGWIDLWFPPAYLTHIAALLVLIAVILIVASYVRGSIFRRLKHPMLIGVMLWALAHLLVNGDLGSIILFTGILLWALVDRVSLHYRSDPGAPPIPAGGVMNDLIAVVVGVALYLLLAFIFHPVVIGVPVFGS